MSGYKTLEGNSLYASTFNENEQMRIGALRWNTQDKHEKAMYNDAAKRVVFWNCMEKCELTSAEVPNFNANFYYNQLSEQKALTTCFNSKMMLHFGKS